MILTAEKHPLTWRLRADGAPVWLDEYQRKQGYEAVRKSIGILAPQDVTALVKESGLRGRGGADACNWRANARRCLAAFGDARRQTYRSDG